MASRKKLKNGLNPWVEPASAVRGHDHDSTVHARRQHANPPSSFPPQSPWPPPAPLPPLPYVATADRRRLEHRPRPLGPRRSRASCTVAPPSSPPSTCLHHHRLLFFSTSSSPGGFQPILTLIRAGGSREGKRVPRSSSPASRIQQEAPAEVIWTLAPWSSIFFLIGW